MLSFTQCLEIGFSSLAILLNIILIPLILFKSSKNIGNYKYLLLSLVFTEILYAWVVATTLLNAREMPDLNCVTLRMNKLHLHASGVFSNVYRGNLLLPNGEQREIAIKKTWPENRERNFEFGFLTGIGREKHKNIVQMLYAFSNKARDDKICESFVFDFMPQTLASVIAGGQLDSTDIRLYAWQMFNGLKYLAVENIVHRDIKPINILVDHDKGHLKIGDFGSAKILRPKMPSTAYQVTRFYRPPELLLGSTYYSCLIDIWSAGCVLAEMLRGQVLFPGRDTKHQLRLVFTAFGSPNHSQLKAMQCPTNLVGEPVIGKGLSELIPARHHEALPLLNSLLVFAPKERMNGTALLKHQYFSPLFSENACRSSGQSVASIITYEDYKSAGQEKEPTGKFSKVLQKVSRGMDFALSPDEKVKSKLASASGESHEEGNKKRVMSTENQKPIGYDSVGHYRPASLLDGQTEEQT